MTLAMKSAAIASRAAEIDIRILEPSRLSIFRVDGGYPHLVIQDEACYPRIRVLRCFPLSDGGEFISLRDCDDHEIGLVEFTSGFDDQSRRIIEEELAKRYFVSTILDVEDARDQRGLIMFKAITDRGPRSFNVQDRQRNIVHLPGGRIYIIDTDGCQYDIPDYRRLPKQTQRMLYMVLP